MDLSRTVKPDYTPTMVGAKRILTHPAVGPTQSLFPAETLSEIVSSGFKASLIKDLGYEPHQRKNWYRLVN